MDVFLLSVVGSFLFFTVILPLFGVVLGLFCYYVMPYVFGGLVSLGLLLVAGVKAVLALWVWLVALLWASSVFLVKLKFRKLGEEIEHYRAAHAILLCGAPYRRKRNEMNQSFAMEGEI